MGGCLGTLRRLDGHGFPDSSGLGGGYEELDKTKNHPASTHLEIYGGDYSYIIGGGSIFTFEIKGGAAEAQAFIDKLRIFSLLANVADVKSLAIHPASTTHSQMTPEELAQSGIRPNTIRLSIGTEHIDDILADLAAALEA